MLCAYASHQVSAKDGNLYSLIVLLLVILCLTSALAKLYGYFCTIFSNIVASCVTIYRGQKKRYCAGLTHTSLSSSEYEAMWLNQRRVWRNLAGGGPPTAPNTATSACDGTYLKKHEGRVDDKTREREGGRTQILMFNLPLNVTPFCQVVIQGLKARVRL